MKLSSIFTLSVLKFNTVHMSKKKHKAFLKNLFTLCNKMPNLNSGV